MSTTAACEFRRRRHATTLPNPAAMPTTRPPSGRRWGAQSPPRVRCTRAPRASRRREGHLTSTTAGPAEPPTVVARPAQNRSHAAAAATSRCSLLPCPQRSRQRPALRAPAHANRAYLRRRGITARIARRGVESSTRRGRHRWRVERWLSWLSCWRRLQVRSDRDSGRWFAFVLLACAVVCFRRLQPGHRERDDVLSRHNL
jgi:hypothetical protein